MTDAPPRRGQGRAGKAAASPWLGPGENPLHCGMGFSDSLQAAPRSLLLRPLVPWGRPPFPIICRWRRGGPCPGLRGPGDPLTSPGQSSSRKGCQASYHPGAL